MSNTPIPVIDIFAGPGGLGEGFSALQNKNSTGFKIALSIEKDIFAYRTLKLRSFYRQFKFNEIPIQYYDFLKGKISEEELYSAYPLQQKAANVEAWNATLGITDERLIDQKIRNSLKGNKKWVLIGGPPCQAYSIVGRARKQLKDTLDENDERVFLYREYYRILAVHNPPVFVMENVKGLLSSRVNETMLFQQIINDLEDPAVAYQKLRGHSVNIKCPGYYLFSLVKSSDSFDLLGNPTFKPEDFIIKTEEYGIPQTRHRIIILGIRKDLKKEPAILQKQKNVSIRKVIGGLPRLRSGISKREDTEDNWINAIKDLASDGYLEGTSKELKEEIINTIVKLNLPRAGRGGEFISCEPKIDYNQMWYLDNNLKGVCNHTTRTHIKKDLLRYFFASCFTKMYKISPKLEDFPNKLLPKHKNAKDGKFSDRFRVQLFDEPSKTITSHISKDGHYYIHPDPTQCRSLTVREAARIQTFPDNYYFCGPRTSQYIQVGNAVPPYLAYQIAKIIKKVLE